MEEPKYISRNIGRKCRRISSERERLLRLLSLRSKRSTGKIRLDVAKGNISMIGEFRIRFQTKLVRSDFTCRDLRDNGRRNAKTRATSSMPSNDRVEHSTTSQFITLQLYKPTLPEVHSRSFGSLTHSHLQTTYLGLLEFHHLAA